jgi:hypothetical protein
VDGLQVTLERLTAALHRTAHNASTAKTREIIAKLAKEKKGRGKLNYCNRSLSQSFF